MTFLLVSRNFVSRNYVAGLCLESHIQELEGKFSIPQSPPVRRETTFHLPTELAVAHFDVDVDEDEEFFLLHVRNQQIEKRNDHQELFKTSIHHLRLECGRHVRWNTNIGNFQEVYELPPSISSLIDVFSQLKQVQLTMGKFDHFMICENSIFSIFDRKVRWSSRDHQFPSSIGAGRRGCDHCAKFKELPLEGKTFHIC